MFQALLAGPGPILALAPMQDVTDLPFWKLMRQYGGADLYFTEFFRVHATSNLEKNILRSLTENPTGRPVIAQMIGNDIPALVRSARQLQQYPIAAIDLNLGCPAPVVYRKCAGGGLLREPARVDAILGALRQATTIPFTVKTRLGFDSTEKFPELLSIFARHQLDLLTVHGRTVKEMYGPHVHYDQIARAVQSVPCPVLANGNVSSPDNAEQILRRTGAAGLMIGRGAIRNPWIFEQIRQHNRGEVPYAPSQLDRLEFIERLYRLTQPPGISGASQVQKMKKYMNYIGEAVSPDFLNQIRRAQSEPEFFGICRRFLDPDPTTSTVQHSMQSELAPPSWRLGKQLAGG